MRTTFSHAILALRLALCLALAACAKSNEALPPRPQAEPSPFESASALQRFGGGICAEGRSTEVAIDEVTDAGFAAEELLAFIEGEHREKMRWSAAEGANISPESGEVELIIVVERASERAFAFDPDTDAIGHGARCWPWLLVDVVVTVQSPGGALNERFEAQLYSADLRVAYLAATTPALELAGALSVARDASDFVASSYELRMSFSEHGVTGSLLSNWSREVQEPRLYWEETIELASWGRARTATRAPRTPSGSMIRSSSEPGTSAALGGKPSS